MGRAYRPFPAPRQPLPGRGASAYVATSSPYPCGRGSRGGGARSRSRAGRRPAAPSQPSPTRSEGNRSLQMTTADPIVILSYARTPMGSFQGALAGASADRARRRRRQRRGRARRRRPRRRRARSTWAASSPPASARPRRARPRSSAGLPQPYRGDHGQQDVRLRHAGGDHGRRHDRRRLAPTSSSPAAWSRMTNAPYLLPKHRGGARIGHDTIVRSHVASTGSRTPMSTAALMGSFAEDTRPRLSVHPRRSRTITPSPA